MENMNDYERERRREQEVRLSSRKRSYMRVMESDEESSADKSIKSTPRPDHTNPPSETNAGENWMRYTTMESESESTHKSDYDPNSDHYAPNPQLDASTNWEAESEHEPTHHKSLNFEDDDFSNSMGGNPNPWIAECDHGTAFLHQQQPLKSHSIDPNMNYLMNCSNKAQPLIRAAWAGAFSVTVKANKERNVATFDGLQGCVSSKACPQARLVAEQLPASIRWEKLPKWRVWPKSFEQRGPTDDDIAVFFFPSLAKHESVYESLVFDLIRDDLALRTTVMGSELLLFTSVDLPPLFTRFQGKLYLWGVFRGNQPRL